MTPASDLTADLIRAANRTSKLSAVQVDRLLPRAVAMIVELRQEANIIPISGRDALIYIRTVLAGVGQVPKEEWHHALLHAAEMIRDLHIIIDTGTEIRTHPT